MRRRRWQIKNTTSNINTAAEELPKELLSKFKEFVKRFMKKNHSDFSLAFISFIILMAIIEMICTFRMITGTELHSYDAGNAAQPHIEGTNGIRTDVFSPSDDDLLPGFSLMCACGDVNRTAMIVVDVLGLITVSGELSIPCYEDAVDVLFAFLISSCWLSQSLHIGRE